MIKIKKYITAFVRNFKKQIIVVLGTGIAGFITINIERIIKFISEAVK